MRLLLTVLTIAAALHASDYAELRKQADAAASRRDYEGARESLRQAIEARIATDGRFVPALVADYLSLALLYKPGDRQKEGLRYLDRASEIVLRGNPVDTVTLADVHSMRAVLLVAAKDPLSAISVLNTAITLRESVAGTSHVMLVPDLDRLASTCVFQRDYECAEAAAKRAIQIRERVLGPEDADLLSMTDVLAYALYGQKKFEEAELAYKRLIALWVTNTGSHNPMLALTLEKVAVFYTSWEKPELAQEAAARAMAIRVHFHASGLAKRAGEELIGGHVQAALKLYTETLAILKVDHPLLDELRKQVQEQEKLVRASLAKPGAAKKKAR